MTATYTDEELEQLTEKFGKLPHPEGFSTEQIVAAHILGQLFGYRPKASHAAQRDLETLAISLEAYRRLVSFC
jgi:hypothetical protein